ncbi:MliC family protein [Amaricoccus sp.]|uniref:MliC family protein n=1 Tax=Amaricoccus sp. TaxID=1872485 RepID=UPI001B64E904|nr:MliC family protein [Amaricoccus sp.]MBP7001148.1 MliC family protein [Amaricoccus sp.]
MPRLPAALLAAPLLASAALPAAAQDAPPALSINYACEGGAELQVAYINPASGPSLAVVGWAGRLIPMRQGPSASGVRYIAFDEQRSYRWWSKGDEGFLVFMAADHEATEEPVLSDCRAIPG